MKSQRLFGNAERRNTILVRKGASGERKLAEKANGREERNYR